MAGDYSDSNHEIEWTDLNTQGGELLFNGTATQGETADSADWQFSGDFTIELFGVKFASKTTRQHLIAQFDTASDDRSFLFRFRGDVAPKILNFLGSTDGTSGNTTGVEADFDPTLDQAYDLCVERSGTTVRIYADGAMLDSGTISGALHDTGRKLFIGISEHDGGTFHDGALKAVRVTNGTARYADDGGYTVPDLPLPTQGTT